MMKFVAIVLTLGVLATAQSPCCFPDVYEGVWSVIDAAYVNGVVYASRNITRVSIDTSDLSNILLEADTSSFNIYTNQRTISSELVRGGISYVYNGTSCIRRPAVYPAFSGCIPATAQLQTHSHIGLGEHKLPFYTWTFPLENQTNDVTVADGCIPISVGAAGSAGPVQYAQTMVILGYTSGIRDRSIFNIPAHCPSSSA